MSAMRPHSKRERSRSSSVGISLGGLSLVMMICLRPVFPRQKLDVIDEQYVHVAILIAEFRRFVVPDRVDQFVGKLFAADVDDVVERLQAEDVMADGLRSE